MIIGLTGSFCAGKDTVADILATHKRFIHRSLSDALRAVLEQRNIPLTRENLIAHGTLLRAAEGNDALARRVLADLAPERHYVVTSIRHPDEVRALQRSPLFRLVHVDAPAQLRFERMQLRARPGDPTTFQRFLELEAAESQTEGPGQQLSACAAMAWRTLMNASVSLSELERDVERLITDMAREVKQ